MVPSEAWRPPRGLPMTATWMIGHEAKIDEVCGRCSHPRCVGSRSPAQAASAR